MTQDKDQQDRRFGMSTAHLTGSALAAMSGALVASLAGTTGTVIGAAVASVIATVGTTMYTESLKRTGTAAKKTATVVRQRGALISGAIPRRAAADPDEGPPPGRHKPSAFDDGDARDALDDQEGEDGEDSEQTERQRRWDLPWAKVAIASLAVMLAGLAGITAVEAVTGQPISSLIGGDDEKGTTVGHVVGSDDSSTKQDRTPKQDTPASEQSDPSSEPTEEPPAPEPSTSEGPTSSPTDGTLPGDAPAP